MKILLLLMGLGFILSFLCTFIGVKSSQNAEFMGTTVNLFIINYLSQIKLIQLLPNGTLCLISPTCGKTRKYMYLNDLGPCTTLEL